MDQYRFDERGPSDRIKWSRAKGQTNQKDPQQFQPFKRSFLEQAQQKYTQDQIVQFRKQNEIYCKQGELEDPWMEWGDCQFDDKIFDMIKKKEYAKPTAIQSQVLPVIMAGKDVIGIAETGSGKTLAYLLPGIVQILEQDAIKEYEGPIMLVLAPTRELVCQIDQQIKFFAQPYRLKTCTVYGGVSKKEQIELIRSGIHVVVACPGRLLDLIRSNLLNLNRVTYLVIDEADRMLDMGFEPDVRTIVDDIRPDRQTVYFSATWPHEVEDLARDFCQNNPVEIQIGKNNLTINKNIKHEVYCVLKQDKYSGLKHILDQLYENDKVLIFAKTKLLCEELARRLTHELYYCIALHGDKSQQERDRIMHDLRSSDTRLLCATDIASRGLDVADITVVINYDFPKQFDDYIHRVGRTGRAAKQGRAVSFLQFGEEQQHIVRSLINFLKTANHPIDQELEQFARNVAPKPKFIDQSRENQKSKPLTDNQLQYQAQYGHQNQRNDFKGDKRNDNRGGYRNDNRGGYRNEYRVGDNRGDNRDDRGDYQGNYRGDNRGDNRKDYRNDNYRGDNRGNNYRDNNNQRNGRNNYDERHIDPFYESQRSFPYQGNNRGGIENKDYFRNINDDSYDGPRSNQRRHDFNEGDSQGFDFQKQPDLTKRNQDFNQKFVVDYGESDTSRSNRGGYDNSRQSGNGYGQRDHDRQNMRDNRDQRNNNYGNGEQERGQNGRMNDRYERGQRDLDNDFNNNQGRGHDQDRYQNNRGQDRRNDDYVYGGGQSRGFDREFDRNNQREQYNPHRGSYQSNREDNYRNNGDRRDQDDRGSRNNQFQNNSKFQDSGFGGQQRQDDLKGRKQYDESKGHQRSHNGSDIKSDGKQFRQ